MPSPDMDIHAMPILGKSLAWMSPNLVLSMLENIVGPPTRATHSWVPTMALTEPRLTKVALVAERPGTREDTAPVAAVAIRVWFRSEVPRTQLTPFLTALIIILV